MEGRGRGFIMVEGLVRDRRAALFDDEPTLRTELVKLKRVSLSFGYTVPCGAEIFATGRTRHGCVNLASGRPLRLPKELYARRDE